MLYHIVIIIIFTVLAFAVFVMFRNFSVIQKRKKDRRLKESEFMSRLVSEGYLKPGQLSGLNDFIEDCAINKDVVELKRTENKINGDEIRTYLFEEIKRMSDEELQQLYRDFQERPLGKPRKHDRKYLFLIVDYRVSDQYYRDPIQDISESGVFIKTSQKFSKGQKIQMTFMSPDHQQPFNIKGEVARTQGDGIGVKFIMESQVQHAALKSFMDNIHMETMGTQ